jgi:tetratricopeptide (TPR) repeat protein
MANSLFFARAMSAIALCASFAGGCSGHSDRTATARQALDRHDAKGALALYNKELEVSSGKELPKKVDGDNALLILDRSLILQQLQDYQNSSRDLETADKQVEMLDFTRSSGHEIGRYLFSDDTGPYKARPFEKLFVNTLNMVNYLTQGNLSGAKVEARRLAVMQKYLSQVDADDPSVKLLGPGSYFAGFAFERAGEYDTAIRYYDEALRCAPWSTLEEPIRRIAPYSGYSSPRLKAAAREGTGEAPDPDSGELLVIVAYGRVPALKANRVPIGLALTAASLYLTGAQTQAARRLAGQGVVSWVNYPVLEPARRNYTVPSVSIDGTASALDTITLVDELVREAYKQAEGPIMASAITRMIARGAVGAGAGVAASRAADSGALGMLAALVTQAALAATDTPDTRSWATLPARIAISRVRVPQGKHTVRIAAQGVTKEQTVEIPKGGFAVVNLTELSQ